MFQKTGDYDNAVVVAQLLGISVALLRTHWRPLARLTYTAAMSLSAIFHALLVGGMPLFSLTFAVVYWALHTQRLSGGTVKALQESMKALGSKQKDKKRRQTVDPVTHQWLRFGGGFYGLVALYTWLLIQWDDVVTFFAGIWDVVFRFDLGSVIALFVELFIESIMNFVAAIAWPVYWLSEDRNPWLLLVAAYAGYWFGIKVARTLYRDHSADEGQVVATLRDGED